MVICCSSDLKFIRFEFRLLSCTHSLNVRWFVFKMKRWQNEWHAIYSNETKQNKMAKLLKIAAECETRYYYTAPDSDG